MSKIPPELRETAAKAVGIERQEVGCRKFGHDGAQRGAKFCLWQGGLSKSLRDFFVNV
jgi:hypothetical protein